MQEGEILVCNDCVKTGFEHRYLQTVFLNGAYCAYIELMVSNSPFNFVYNANHDYYNDTTQDIRIVNGSYIAAPSNVELRALYPEKCNPYFQIDSTLFDVLKRHLSVSAS